MLCRLAFQLAVLLVLGPARIKAVNLLQGGLQMLTQHC
jgi:hypothetical protein